MKREQAEKVSELLRESSKTLKKLAEQPSEAPAHTINLTELRKLASEKQS